MLLTMHSNPSNPSVHPGAALLRGPGPFFTTTEQRAQRARELFFDEGQRPSGLVPEWVIQSWVRCSVAQRRPSEAIAFEPVTPSRVQSALARNRLLLQAAQEDLSELDAALAPSSCKALLIGVDGIVIRATPTARGESRIMPAIARVGVATHESLIGTTAPSVAAYTGQTCLVRGPEHFFAGISQMHCAAAPIHHAHGQLAGVLDLSCEGGPFRFDAAGMVQLYATAIENRLFEAQSTEMLLLRFQSTPSLLKTPLQGLAAVDAQGRVACLNQTGAKLLGTERVPLHGNDVECLFGAALVQMLDLAQRGEPRALQLPNGLRLWVQAQLGASGRWNEAELTGPVPAAAMPASTGLPAPTNLQSASLALIKDTLRACQGNVSQAARQLGVSRGLLYRRMADLQASTSETAQQT
jgi:transcriptional regulator of acetoin/glycerol metabolism